MQKFVFELSVEDGWPPVEAESLWFERRAAGYQLRSIPFFVRGVALDDLVELKKVDEKRARISRVLEPSGNSTFWVFLRDSSVREELLGALDSVGVKYEGGGIRDYIAASIPNALNLAAFDALIAKWEQTGSISVAFGAINHPD